MFCSILTQSGDVLVFWPFSGEISRLFEEEKSDMNSRPGGFPLETDDGLRCATLSLRADPLRLPNIPQLPELESSGMLQEERLKTTILVKIAAFDSHLIGLTNKGHVLKFGALSNDDGFDWTLRWQYVRSPCICVMLELTCDAVGEFQRTFQSRHTPRFPRRERWFAGPEISADHACNTWHTLGVVLRFDTIPQITAQYTTFVAYSTGSSSITLMGNERTDKYSHPEIIPELQNRSIISIVLGECHSGALTADGQLLTWGPFCHGALGLGVPSDLPLGTPGGYSSNSQHSQARRSEWPPEPPRVASPSPVHFNHGPKPGGRRFCFAATAAGRHTGALVICLEVGFPFFEDHSKIWLTYNLYSPRKRNMTIVSPPKTVHPFCLDLGCLVFAKKRHLGAIIHLPYSDLVVEYSGLDLQGMRGRHRGHRLRTT